jgi:predicted transglutaminase-like cysteine proteinase
MQAAQRQGGNTPQRAQVLVQLIGEVAAQDEESRLRAVNSFFNRSVQYRDDREIWGQIDYWASPLESLARGQADCEDYAIAKYFSLLASGVPGVKMRLVYVRAQLAGSIQAHMVLAYYPQPDAEPLILDNLITDIRPASRRPDLAPPGSGPCFQLQRGRFVARCDGSQCGGPRGPAVSLARGAGQGESRGVVVKPPRKR